jgi:hypothetical protein
LGDNNIIKGDKAGTTYLGLSLAAPVDSYRKPHNYFGLVGQPNHGAPYMHESSGENKATVYSVLLVYSEMLDQSGYMFN